MNQFDLNVIDGHLTFVVDGLRVLVDTGSPFTISRNTKFCFLGREYESYTEMGGCGMDSLSENAGFDFDVLMGMGILGNYRIVIDASRESIIFSEEAFSEDNAVSLPITQGMKGVAFDLLVNGQSLKGVLDTGAKISYIIAEEIVKNEQPKEFRDDFSPFVGHFETPIYPMRANVAEMEFSVDFGVLPGILSLPLRMVNIGCVLGYDLFKQYVVGLDFVSNKMTLKNFAS